MSAVQGALGKIFLADSGAFALYLAVGMAALGATLSLVGGFLRREDLRAAGRAATFSILILTTFAVLRLEVALHTHDFAFEYVWGYTNRAMPWHYLTAALWGGMNGSLLFWSWLLIIYGSVAVLWGRRKAPELLPYANAVILIVWLLFGLIVTIEANPFSLILHPATNEPFVPPDGRGLNPLLQNYWMMIHPVMLYTGFVGFTVPFAFAIGALVTGKLDAQWLGSTRRWSLWAWGVLGVAIVLGGTWAYEELGWGGYWAWDPVENASFIPWLTGTAYIHSVIVQEKRGMLKVWNVVLIILTFHLCIFGTFLTRSGIVSSVHAFSEGNIGWYFLTFLGLSLLVSTVLVLWRSGIRAPAVLVRWGAVGLGLGYLIYRAIDGGVNGTAFMRGWQDWAVMLALAATAAGWRLLLYVRARGEGVGSEVMRRFGYDPARDLLKGDNRLESVMAKETLFLVNNLLFLSFAIIVIVGTMLPVFTEMLAGTKWVVGQPFFNFFAAPAAMFLLLLTAFGQAVAWRKTSSSGLMKSLMVPSVAGLIALPVFGFISYRAYHWVVSLNGWPAGDERIGAALGGAIWATVGFSLCVFLAAGVVWELTRALRALLPKYAPTAAMLALFRNDANRRRYGGYLVHLSFSIVCAGIIGSSAFGVERPLQLDVNQPMHVGDFTFTLVRPPDVRRGDNHEAVIATVRAEKGGKKLGTMFPEKRFYRQPGQEQPTTEPSIGTFFWRDLYLIIEQYQTETGVNWPVAPLSMRLWINPMVQWIWKGMFFFGLSLMLCYFRMPKWMASLVVARARRASPAGGKVPAGASARVSPSAPKEDA